MCTRANMASAMPMQEVGEKSISQAPNELVEMSEKANEKLPLIPSPDLECLQEGYDPKNLQMILREGILLATGYDYPHH
jgi:hypothetical protein